MEERLPLLQLTTRIPMVPTDYRRWQRGARRLWTLGRLRDKVAHIMTPEEITEQLRARFPDVRCDIVDLTGTKDHYELHIASEHFRGLTPIAIHRLVYAALGGAVGTSIHALSVKASLPETWNR